MKNFYKEVDIGSHKMTITKDKYNLSPRIEKNNHWLLKLKIKDTDLSVPDEFILHKKDFLNELMWVEKQGFLVQAISNIKENGVLLSYDSFSFEPCKEVVGYAIMYPNILKKSFDNEPILAYKTLIRELLDLAAYYNDEVYQVTLIDGLQPKPTTTCIGGFYPHDINNLKELLRDSFKLEVKYINEIIENLVTKKE